MCPTKSRIDGSARARRGPDARAGRGVRYGPGGERGIPRLKAVHFGVRSAMAMAIHPQVDRPYLFGVHQWRVGNLSGGGPRWPSPLLPLKDPVGPLNGVVTSPQSRRDPKTRAARRSSREAPRGGTLPVPKSQG